MKMRLTTALGLLLTLALFLGCGPSGPPQIPVKGKVTFGGGVWPKAATLDFACEEPAAGMPRATVTAVVEGEGNYSVKLIPGKYIVNITCNEIEPTPDKPNTLKSYIPDRFRTGKERQKIDVPLDAKGPIEMSWDIPKQ